MGLEEQMPTVRRVVTGTNDAGRSVVLSDAVVPPIVMDAFGANELWKTSEAPASLERESDQCEGDFVLEPDAHGNVFRVVVFPPDSSLKTVEDGGGTASQPDLYWHQTKTIDYIVVIAGELWCMLEDGEVHLTAGDVLVQRGTVHAWSVRGDEPCTMVAVLVDAA
jgi:hypothetical protein